VKVSVLGVDVSLVKLELRNSVHWRKVTLRYLLELTYICRSDNICFRRLQELPAYPCVSNPTLICETWRPGHIPRPATIL
jgi:hypothetical protein